MSSHYPLLRRNPLLRPLPDATVEVLAGQVVVRRLAPGALWISRRQKAKGIAVIAEGGLRSTSITREGREFVFSIMRPDDIWGIVSTIDGAPNANDVYAYGETTLLTIGRGTVRQLMVTHPDFSVCLLNILSHRLRMANALLEGRALQPLDVRMARLLMSMAGVTWSPGAAESVDEPIEVTQETLRKLLGCSRPTVNQLLKRFVRDGLIRMQYGRLRLVDLAGLGELSGAAHHPYF